MNTNQTQTQEITPPGETLIAIIYNLTAAMMAFGHAIGTDFKMTERLRHNCNTRLNRLLWALLGLTTRIDPFKIGKAFFARPRPAQLASAARPSRERHPARPARPQPAATPTAPPAQPGYPKLQRPRPPLSARRIAQRLAAIFRELNEIAQDAGHPIPADLKDLCDLVSTQAGCNALHPSHYEQATKTELQPGTQQPPKPNPTTPEPAAPESLTPEPWRTLEL